jgi:hypothetical protein
VHAEGDEAQPLVQRCLLLATDLFPAGGHLDRAGRGLNVLVSIVTLLEVMPAPVRAVWGVWSGSWEGQRPLPGVRRPDAGRWLQYGTGWHWLDVVWCLSSREPLAIFDLGSGEV